MTRLHFLDGQNFDCSGCAKCCRSPWQVAVDEPSRRRIQELPVHDGLVRSASGTWVTARREGACIFLTEQNRCSVHEQLGEDAKPHTCRQFPFLYQDTPAGVYVGISLYCSAAQRNQGRSLAAHDPELRGLLRQAPGRALEGDFLLTEDSRVDWPTYLELEASLANRARVAEVLLALARWEGTGELRASLSAPPPTQVDPMLVWMEASFVAGLVARLEATTLEAVLQNEVKICGGPRPGEVQQAMRAVSPAWLQDQLERYREALLFRKFLLTGERPILENLLVLHLTLRVAEFYAWAQALAREAGAPEPEDLYAALDRCELDLVTHGQEAFTMSASFWRFFRERALASAR